MANKLDEFVTQMAPKLEAEIRAAFVPAGGFKMSRLAAGSSRFVDATDDFDTIVSGLAEHFAKRIADAVVVGRQEGAKTAAAASVSRLAAPAAMQATAEELAWQEWSHEGFGTERKFDPDTGQRIQTVRVVP